MTKFMSFNSAFSAPKTRWTARDRSAAQTAHFIDLPVMPASGTLAHDLTKAAASRQETTDEGTDGLASLTAGTRIATLNGLRAVEDLRVGERVMTMDSGYQPLRWIGRQDMNHAASAEAAHLCPIRIQAGALGRMQPATDLLVSPQKKVLLRSEAAFRMFGDHEVLVSARNLVALDGVDVATDCRAVTYFQLILDRHEIIFANGIATETLHLSPQALRALPTRAREEICLIFPETGGASPRPRMGGLRQRNVIWPRNSCAGTVFPVAVRLPQTAATNASAQHPLRTSLDVPVKAAQSDLQRQLPCPRPQTGWPGKCERLHEATALSQFRQSHDRPTRDAVSIMATGSLIRAHNDPTASCSFSWQCRRISSLQFSHEMHAKVAVSQVFVQTPKIAAIIGGSSQQAPTRHTQVSSHGAP